MERKVASLIASVLLGGEWSRPGCLESLQQLSGSRSGKLKWQTSLVESLFDAGGFAIAPTEWSLRRFLETAHAIGVLNARIINSATTWAAGINWLDLPRPQMTPQVAKAKSWDLPVIVTTGALADQLNCSVGRLEWLADIRGNERTLEKEKVRNYRYTWVKKRAGGFRLIECPKASLKQIQRWILANIADRIPAHEAAHGFVSGRSPVTAARIHENRHVVLRIDLQDFFTAISGHRIAGIFRAVGYPSRVTKLLTGLCTNTAWEGALDEIASDPADVPACKARHERLFFPHLPQGTPTSPALANLAAYSLDCRLQGLAQKFHAKYSRYADDLVFSGDLQFAKRLSDFRLRCLAVVHNEGFEIRRRKTRVMYSHEQQTVTGVVVNRRVNIARSDFDDLKATLHNCIIHGPQNQNRMGVADFNRHLRGRIAWVSSLNEQRGRKLMAMFREINWQSER